MPHFIARILQFFHPKSRSFAQFKNDPKLSHQLIYAVFTADLIRCKELLEQGVRPTQEMMYFSIGAQQYEITALLLQRNPPEDSRYFHFAQQNMDEKMRDLLLEYKMEPDLTCKEMRAFMAPPETNHFDQL